MSPPKPAVHAQLGVAAPALGVVRPPVSPPGRDDPVNRERLLELLANLRTVVPVFARELVAERRQAASLRAENVWLLEQVRILRRQRGQNKRPVHEPVNQQHGDGAGSARTRERAGEHPGHQRATTHSGHDAMATVELTPRQSARIESLPEDCAIVGVREGCPLVRQASGEVALLGYDGRLMLAAPGMSVVPYTEVSPT